MKFLRRLLIALIIVGVGGYGFAEASAKRYAEKAIAEKVKQVDPAANEVEAHVSSPLLFGVLSRGTIDKITVSADHLKVGSFTADKTTGVLHGVHIDKAESLKQKKPVIESIDQADVTVEISDVEVSKALPRGLSFRFEDSLAILQGPGFSVEGTLEVEAHNSVRFRPKAVGLPRGVAPPALRFGDIAFLNCIDGIELHKGGATITCSKKNPPVGLMREFQFGA
jgi:hypothetical protein